MKSQILKERLTSARICTIWEQIMGVVTKVNTWLWVSDEICHQYRSQVFSLDAFQYTYLGALQVGQQ